jgi:hypothetical protein
MLRTAVAALFLLSTVFCAINSKAQNQDELVKMTVQGTSRAATAEEASSEIVGWATASTAREQAIELIGEARYQRNKSAIETKIVKQSSKFIPFINPGELTKEPDGTWKMPVELKISSASLRKLVLEAGLLNDADGPASILPLIAFIDRSKGTSLRWWLGEPKDEEHRFLVETERITTSIVQAELLKQGFHLVSPPSSPVSVVPENYRVDRPVNSDQAFLGDYFKTPIIAKGDVRFKSSKDLANGVTCTVKIQVIQATSGRTIGDVSRLIALDNGATEAALRGKFSQEMNELAKDLSTQVLEAWQRGTLNSKQVRLSLRGNLGPKDLLNFKASLGRAISEIKSIKERAFERGLVQFEVDYTGDAASLSEKFKSAQFNGFTTKFLENTQQGIVIEVKPGTGKAI